MFRIAEKQDMPGIIALWQEAFGDEKQAVEDFFSAFPKCISYVAEEQGEILAMAHAIPQTLSPNTGAVYIYAVATAKASRGRGLCRNLMAFAEQIIQNVEEVREEPLDMEQLQNSPGLVGYIAKPGDDLWSIAKENHTTLQDIMDTNHLRDQKISGGDKILIVKRVG